MTPMNYYSKRGLEEIRQKLEAVDIAMSNFIADSNGDDDSEFPEVYQDMVNMEFLKGKLAQITDYLQDCQSGIEE